MMQSRFVNAGRILTVVAAVSCAALPMPLFGAGAGDTGIGGAEDVSTGAIVLSGVRDSSAELLGVPWEALRGGAGRLVVDRFSLPDGQDVRLDLQRFEIIGPRTRFVIGRKSGGDVGFDPHLDRFVFLRGSVVGRAGSHVFMSLTRSSANGYVDLGPGRASYRIGSPFASALPTSLNPNPEEGGVPPGVPYCGVDRAPADGGVASAGEVVPTSLGMRHLELAVETDYEFYSLFADGEAAAGHVVQLYAVMSDIFMRDVNTRIEITFVRLWDTPDDLFNQPDPLGSFRFHWNANMDDVNRDVAQFLSGRRDLPWGGVAYPSALCTGFAYSVVGYITGNFGSPGLPITAQYDIGVAAHELGHNAGAGHTHGYTPPIDRCFPLPGVPSRGTIMSYCGQTISGGSANRDLRFHKRVQDAMGLIIGSSVCVVLDCNRNDTDDADDVSSGQSRDENGNGVPDECEDCDESGTLDPAEIASGDLSDVNGNGIPDVCEPDCNGNGRPDDSDIALLTSDDLFGNNIPDECEPDCDSSGVSDYTEIQADMTRDINRDRILDSCEDCDGDGVLDATALGGAHGMWMVSNDVDLISEFHGASGVRMRDAEGGHTSSSQDLIITPDGRILVSSGGDDRIVEYDALTGAYLGDLVPSGSGGLRFPTGMTIGPDGSLYVGSRDTSAVLKYDGTTGAFQGIFVSSGSGGLVEPFGLVFGPNGNLFVTSALNEVLEYDGVTGASVGPFVASTANGGLVVPRGLVFIPDGHLLVTSLMTDRVLEFDGRTGAFVGIFNNGGTSAVLRLNRPWGIRVGPTGNVFVSRSGIIPVAKDADAHTDESSRVARLHINTTLVYEYDVRNGLFLRSFAMGTDSGFTAPTGFDFVPGWSVDCNLNLLPDACDIASGASADVDANSIPDQCEVDCNGNGVQDVLDLIPFGSSFDCNGNRVPDECDIASGASGDCNGDGTPNECDPDCNGNGVPDGCEPDCNGNGRADGCDILLAASFDLNGDAIPDECLSQGDADADGDVDLGDFGVFAGCDGRDRTSPDFVDPPSECLVFDFDLDGDVDLLDFGAVQDGYTGECGIEILAGPTEQAVCPGSAAVFSIEASGPNLSYQWRRNGENIIGENTAVLGLSPVSFGSVGLYSASVFNGCGFVTSAEAQLRVLDPPSILEHPVDTEACLGGAASFTVGAVGEGLVYQWLRGTDPVDGGNAATLELDPVTKDDVAVYRCMVTDGLGCVNVSASATLSLAPGTTITSQPVGGDFCVGDEVTLFAASSGASPSYQWFKDGAPLAGQTLFFLAIAPADVSDSGTYHVEITGVCDTAVSDPAVVTVTVCLPD
jgi:outer membrane protein assembly factor BamB